MPSDADELGWFNRDWTEDARQFLERYNAVQLFDHVTDTDREGRLGQRSPGHVYARTHGLEYGRPGGRRLRAGFTTSMRLVAATP